MPLAPLEPDIGHDARCQNYYCNSSRALEQRQNFRDLLREKTPSPSPVPTQRIAPTRLKSRNRNHPTPIAPASGGVTVDRPGMKFETRSVFVPQRSKIDCVWPTHVSGVRDTLQS